MPTINNEQGKRIIANFVFGRKLRDCIDQLKTDPHPPPDQPERKARVLRVPAEHDDIDAPGDFVL